MQQYFYAVNYTEYEEDLCKMEMKYLFGTIPCRKYFFSFHELNPSRSAFIKSRIKIIYSADTINKIIDLILSNDFSSQKFKVCFISTEDEDIGYKERLKAEYDIGFNINGRADIHNPNILFGIAHVNGKWIFGELTPNDLTWKYDNNKRFYYSNALSVRVARAIVNIAAGNDLKCKLVDPCCGIGTVVIEALSMGIRIKGYEINPIVAGKAKINLKYLGFPENIIQNEDMHDIAQKFDAAIIDLPYGLFSLTTHDAQLDIIKTARKIADRMLIITLENMDKDLVSCGFQIKDRCTIKKSSFTRHVTLCESLK